MEDLKIKHYIVHILQVSVTAYLEHLSSSPHNGWPHLASRCREDITMGPHLALGCTCHVEP